MARGAEIEISYLGGAMVRVGPGTSVLEASRMNGIAHYSICGGNGRCSTCRVRVLSSDTPLQPPNSVEQATLARIHAERDVRLACQLRPEGALIVARLLEPPQAQAGQFDDTPPRERDIAVLFCDLRSFTSLSERQLPYDVVFLLNRYFAAMGEAITDSDGHIDKFIGDGIMALFGMKSNPVSGSRQALAAAARMSARIDGLNAAFAHELPQKLKIGIGIHSGMAVLGEMGWGTAKGLTAIGDCVNTASRLESMTKDFGAELIVSEDVERNCGLDLSPWPAHEITVRGRTTPMLIRAFPRARELSHAVALRPAAAVLPQEDAA